LQEIELLNTLQELIQSGAESNIKLAFELGKGQNISEEQLLLPWEPLVSFLEAHYLNFIRIRKECAIKILSKTTQTTELNSVVQFDQKTIKKLPESIGLMINLREIDLVNNHLSTLPKSFKNLVNLNSLNIVHNNIKFLPKEIKTLSNLDEIFWSSNDIQVLPRTLNFPTTLKILTLDGNRLKKVPPSLGNYIHLQFLNLSNNLLETIPKSLFKLEHLKKLHLGENRLSLKEKQKITTCLPNCKVYF
jgi:Leucine-rich repeat (LRR) protein